MWSGRDEPRAAVRIGSRGRPPRVSSAELDPCCNPSGLQRPLERYLARLEVRADLALHALERVVHGLRVAPELGGDGLVRVAVEVERQHRALVGPGRTSSSVGSESPEAAGVDENETYWFSGECLLRVEVFTAVMICRVMHSSAKLRKLDSRSDL